MTNITIDYTKIIISNLIKKIQMKKEEEELFILYM
jgi:hypothetical protein